ncbi:MAG: hypothetical protein WC934_13345 [Acidithiobacillus sp.]|uniref:hypothetical protein n=1 Tax=Acidithiobacillus sp. TaxID=1872118 RepID=UPI003560F175
MLVEKIYTKDQLLSVKPVGVFDSKPKADSAIVRREAKFNAARLSENVDINILDFELEMNKE